MDKIDGGALTNILVVDDDPSSLYAIRRVLEPVAADVVECASGERALRELMDREFAVVLLDVHLPGISGFELATLIRKDAGLDTPIVFLTGLAHDDARMMRAYELGAVDYLYKPVIREILLAKVRTFVELKRRSTQLLEQEKKRQELEVQLFHADRLASIGRLASGVAHEINNPAAFVQSNLHFVNDILTRFAGMADQSPRAASRAPPEESFDGSDEHTNRMLHEARSLLNESLEGVDRIVKIVRGLKSFSRSASDDVEFLDLNAVVELACAMTRNEIRHRAELITDLAPLPLLAGDRGQLTQALINLLTNSADAIQEGAADQNRIVVRTFEARDCEICIVIEDTGSGIPEHVLSHVFEPFFTTKPRDRGTGLGLSLCADIVRRHGGRIDVESPDRGTRMSITLPRDTPMILRANKPQPAPVPASGPSRELRILVIDDEVSLGKALCRTLNRAGHEAQKAMGGQEALAIFERDADFDVVICDLMMPEVDGVMVYRWLAEHRPELLERLIFHTGAVFTERAKAFVASVANICLEKPVASSVLLDTVRRVASDASVAPRGGRRRDHGVEPE